MILCIFELLLLFEEVLLIFNVPGVDLGVVLIGGGFGFVGDVDGFDLCFEVFEVGREFVGVHVWFEEGLWRF
jgi:hypothetical protein